MRASMLVALLVSAGTVTLVSAGCTFGGLANYTIASCEPATAQDKDICDRLNTDPESCAPYQCDGASRHCVQRTRDDDHDGDPPTKCGGTDCDDKNAARSGRAKEVCDDADNDCDELVDEDAISAGQARVVAAFAPNSSDPILAPVGDSRINALAAAYTGNCIPFVSLEPGSGGAIGSGCAVSDQSNVPHQPYPVVLGTGSAAAFVGTNTCPAGYLVYRSQTSNAALVTKCGDLAALPAVAAMPSTANANSGLVVWYRAALSDRQDPVGGCASLQPAKLAIARIDSLANPPTDAAAVTVKTPDETSLATRPAALLPLEAAGGMLVSTPLGNDVGVWLFTPSALAQATLPPATHVPLANARSTALAARVENGSLRGIALAAEIGCRPSASIKLVLGNIDVTSKAITFEAPIEVAAPSDVATAPSVAWVPKRQEWWVAWVDAVPHARIRRFAADGKPIGGVIEAGQQLPLAIVSGGNPQVGPAIFGVDPTLSGGSYVEIPLNCQK